MVNFDSMKHILIIILSIFAIPSAIAAVSGEQPDSLHAPSAKYQELIGKADDAIKDSNWEDAESFFLEAMRTEPGNPTNILLMSNVGMLRHYAGKDSLALDMLDAAARMAPVSVTVKQNRATVLTSLGRLEEAYDEYNRIIGLDSTLAEPRFMRAMIDLKLGNVEKAESDVDYMLRNFPDEQDTWTAAAYTYIATARFADAIPYLSKIIEQNPQPGDYGERALCYLMTDNLPDASTDIAEAIRLDPLNGDFYLYRSLLNKRRYRPKEAADDARKAAGLGVSARKIATLGLYSDEKQQKR